jgi:flagellar basal body-associated protein FliL
MDRETRELIVVLTVMLVLFVFGLVCVIIFFHVMRKESKAERERARQNKTPSQNNSAAKVEPPSKD